MTLRKLLTVLDLRITHPEVLANLELGNYECQCILALQRYFHSSKFHSDMDSAVLEIEDRVQNGASTEDFVLRFLNDGLGKLTLTVSQSSESFVDSIDTYQ